MADGIGRVLKNVRIEHDILAPLSGRRLFVAFFPKASAVRPQPWAGLLRRVAPWGLRKRSTKSPTKFATEKNFSAMSRPSLRKERRDI